MEWRVALGEIVEAHHFKGVSQPFAMVVHFLDGDVLLEARDIAGGPLVTVEVPRVTIAAHLDEYLGICRDLSKLGNANAARYEALDIAKRISHDEAADTLVTVCRSLGPDQSTARRLFTLLVTLHVDTTRLAVPHHRR